MKASGPREERETIIVWSDADETATIWTASDSVYRQMVKRGWVPSADGERHAQFVVPKSCVKLPRQKSSTRGFAGRKSDESA